MKRFPLLTFLCAWAAIITSAAEDLKAGAARVNITREGHDAGNNPLWVKALVITDGKTRAVLVTVDAVAIAEIGSIRDPYLANVRKKLAADPGIDAGSIIINASHCHGIVAPDVEERTVAAVREAWKNLVPVTVKTGSGREERIMQNRRLILKNGREADVRHAYALPPNDEVAAVGPIDPEIGILLLERKDSGKPMAAVYHFACHPIQGVPSGGNTADLSGFASSVIERNLGDGTATAFFVQGCGGDINPADYKNFDRPRDAEVLGNMLGLSALDGIRDAKPCEATLAIRNETVEMPLADHSGRIDEMEKEIESLVASFRGATLDFEKFFPLYIKYRAALSPYPSAESHRYLQDEMLGKGDWKKLDEDNRAAIDAYLANLRNMEELTRRQINLALLRKHQARYESEGRKTVATEVAGLRVGDFRLITFPAEVCVRIGLNIKKASPHRATYVSGYTNGYLYYAPTAEQMKNRGGAQEDSDCRLAPEWQAIFEAKAAEFLKTM